MFFSLKPKLWNDGDIYCGNLTVSKSNDSALAFVISSGDDEDSGASIKICVGHYILILSIPQFFFPTKKKIIAHSCVIEEERKFGFSYSENYLLSYIGAGERSAIWWFFPWKKWRHIRHSFYGLDGSHFSTHVTKKGTFNPIYRKEQPPSVSFNFKDFDGESLTAITQIEEREWHRGVGFFSWLSFFYSPKIERSLQIEFSGETGPRKRSWKGGIISCGIEMLPGELHTEAFKRYCELNNMVIANK